MPQLGNVLFQAYLLAGLQGIDDQMARIGTRTHAMLRRLLGQPENVVGREPKADAFCEFMGWSDWA